jgi:hypothetical protein
VESGEWRVKREGRREMGELRFGGTDVLTVFSFFLVSRTRMER